MQRYGHVLWSSSCGSRKLRTFPIDSTEFKMLRFYSNMEGLHFQSEREASKNPTPLLLAAILYVSALHHTSVDLAGSAPEYFRATCSAIAELSIPLSLKRSGIVTPVDPSRTPPTAEQIGYQNVLGLILAGLISEAFIDLTGIWISIGYRLVLDHCPVWIDESSGKWRQLFSGLQVFPRTYCSVFSLLSKVRLSI